MFNFLMPRVIFLTQQTITVNPEEHRNGGSQNVTRNDAQLTASFRQSSRSLFIFATSSCCSSSFRTFSLMYSSCRAAFIASNSFAFITGNKDTRIKKAAGNSQEPSKTLIPCRMKLQPQSNKHAAQTHFYQQFGTQSIPVQGLISWPNNHTKTICLGRLTFKTLSQRLILWDWSKFLRVHVRSTACIVSFQ